ncbi:MAG: UPF0175 family protein [Gallionellaceae bacterium]|nr:MAG: UPF0175 family protein [Gallionellaceae bacterium]
MQNVIEIECPAELLIGLNTNAEDMAQLVRREAALGLFRDGRISSGMVSRWLGVPRVAFLLDAMRHDVVLLDDSEDDLRRESQRA